MGTVNKNPNSHLTAKERDKLSFPGRVLLERGLLKGRVLDFGCGLGRDVAELRAKGIEIQGYDPHYYPTKPKGKFDTIICLYVLNVLLSEERSDVIVEVSKLLSENGKAYYAVRRDIRYEGFRRHKIHGVDTYQCLVRLPFTSVYCNDFTEIYEYRPFTSISSASESQCPFCNQIPFGTFIMESHTAYSVFDKYPVSEGHALVIPKRHCSNFFDLSLHEQKACVFLINKVREHLDEIYSPAGFNIGINVNEVAGQTVAHAHIHIIPRYEGDQEDPTGGVRGVIPEKKNYLSNS